MQFLVDLAISIVAMAVFFTVIVHFFGGLKD